MSGNWDAALVDRATRVESASSDLRFVNNQSKNNQWLRRSLVPVGLIAVESPPNRTLLCAVKGAGP